MKSDTVKNMEGNRTKDAQSPIAHVFTAVAWAIFGLSMASFLLATPQFGQYFFLKHKTLYYLIYRFFYSPYFYPLIPAGLILSVGGWSVSARIRGNAYKHFFRKLSVIFLVSLVLFALEFLFLFNVLGL